MVFTLRLHPIRGYDYEKVRRALTKAGVCTHDPDLQPRSLSVRSAAATVQFTKRSVRIDVRDEDSASIIRFVYLVACASSWAASASGDPPSFEIASYDFRGTQSMPTMRAFFTEFVKELMEKGTIDEAGKLLLREIERMVRIGSAVQDLEERIREEGPEAALLELEAYEPEEFRRLTEKMSRNGAGELRMTPCLWCEEPRTNPRGCVSLVSGAVERSRWVMPRILPVAAAS